MIQTSTTKIHEKIKAGVIETVEPNFRDAFQRGHFEFNGGLKYSLFEIFDHTLSEAVRSCRDRV